MLINYSTAGTRWFDKETFAGYGWSLHAMNRLSAARCHEDWKKTAFGTQHVMHYLSQRPQIVKYAVLCDDNDKREN